MDYTNSQYYTQHANGQRMHSDTSTPATVLSDDDINSVIWSMMEVIKAGNQTAQTFNPNQAATYQVLREAIKDLIKQEKESVFINDSEIPTVYQGDVIALKLPHLRWFVWTGSAYVRAPWHQPGQLAFFSHNNTVPGFLPVRADVTYDKADYPDFVSLMGLTGTGTFSLVEARGKFIRCTNNGAGIDVNRQVYTTQQSTMLNDRIGVDGNAGYVMGIINGELQSRHTAVASGWAEAGSAAPPTTQGYLSTFKLRPDNLSMHAQISI